MSLDIFRISDQSIRRCRRLFIGLIIASLLGLAGLLALNWLGLIGLDHPVVFLFVGMLAVAALLEFALESLRQAGRHEDRWWRP